jgi:hypothetical protein
VVKAFVSLQRASRAKRCAWNCSATRASGSAPRWRRRRSLPAALPRTRSGKIMRRLLKARELGLPEGDTSHAGSGGRIVTVQPPAGPPQPPAPSTQPVPYDRAFAQAAGRHAAHPPHGGKVRRALRRQKIRGFLHLYIGEEAVRRRRAACAAAEDNMVATYREHGHALVRGVPMNVIMAEMYGRLEGCSRGRGGSMHLFDRATRFRRQCHRRRRPAAGGRLALADKMQGTARA